MKLPKLDDVVSCFSSCTEPKKEFLAGEGYAFFRRESEETILVHLCPACGMGARKIGIPAQLMSDIIARENGRQQREDEEQYALEMHDSERQAANDLFASALFACEVPLCNSPMEVSTKMSALTSKTNGVEGITPICASCAEMAKKQGVKVTNLHATIERLAREARAALVYELDQTGQKLIGEFFSRFQKVDPREMQRTAVVHQDDGFCNRPTKVDAGNKK